MLTVEHNFSVQLYIESLCHGNLLEEEAIEISNILAGALFLDSIPPLPTDMWHQERVLCLPAGANFIRNAKVKNEMEVNSVVEVCNIYLILSVVKNEQLRCGCSSELRCMNINWNFRFGSLKSVDCS